MDSLNLFINGKHVPSASGATFQNMNPGTGKALHQVALAGEEDVNQAVASAQEAFKIWSKKSPTERGRVLTETARKLKARNDELAKQEVLDTGKPLREAISVDIQSGADALEYFGGQASSLNGEYIELGGDFAYTRREPLGVCGGLGAWNYPMQIACWKAAPALACGNTMVFKPSELTPLTATLLAEIFMEAGLPAGAFNVVHGDASVGSMLNHHPGIAKVSLTGGADTGKVIMREAAGTLKHVTLELGGKSPIIVYEDADIPEAVYGAMIGNFYTQGEICTNGTRVFVENSIADKFLDTLVEETRKLKIGDPMQMETQIGALISREHYENVLDYIKLGQEEGAKLHYGGNKKVLQSPNEGGCFVEPTIFTGCEDHMRIVQEEIFGPVLSLLTFDSKEEAIRRANDTPYGLAGGVYTKDLRKAHETAGELQAGMCWINSYNLNPVEIPFGGYKQSGLGRENGRAALDYYSQLKTVYVGMNDMGSPF